MFKGKRCSLTQEPLLCIPEHRRATPRNARPDAHDPRLRALSIGIAAAPVLWPRTDHAHIPAQYDELWQFVDPGPAQELAERQHARVDIGIELGCMSSDSQELTVIDNPSTPTQPRKKKTKLRSRMAEFRLSQTEKKPC